MDEEFDARSELVGKPVLVSTLGSSETITGNLYTIDPLSHNIVLVQFNDQEPNSVVLIPGDSVKEVRVAEGAESTREFSAELDVQLASLFGKTSSSAEEDAHTVALRKQRLKKWLSRNHVSVREEGVALVVFDVVRVEPPFTPDNCLCENQIVLQRIRTMIERMPEDT